MKEQNGKFRKRMLGLVGALGIGLSSLAHAQTNLTYGPITEDVTLVPVERTEYSVNASNSA